MIFWAIECYFQRDNQPGQDLKYLTMHKQRFTWTTDIHQALRFSDKRAADLMAENYEPFENRCNVAQHEVVDDKEAILQEEMGRAQKVGDKLYRMTVFRVLDRDNSDIPLILKLIQDHQVVNVKEGDQFMTAFIPDHMVR